MNHFYTTAIRNLITIIFIGFVIVSCLDETEESNRFTALSSRDTGIDFQNQLHDTPDQNIIEYLYYYNGGGVALGDINNDQLVDIYFTANQGVNKLYLNKGNLLFEDVTGSYGLPTDFDSSKWSTGAVMVDVNGDGFLDIYECVVGDYKSFSGHNKLYLNQQGTHFLESSRTYGLNFSGFSTQSAFLDYDQDGDLDMYLLNHSVHGTDTYGKSSLRAKRDAKSGDRFFENRINEGDYFVDVTSEVGIYSSSIGYGLSVGVADFNNDSFLDIYVGNDFHEDDYLYLNNGTGTFDEVSGNYFGHTSQFTMGHDVADINQDGKLDIFSLDMLPSDATILLKSAGDDDNFVKDIKAENGYRPQYSRNAMQINQGDYFKELALFYDVYATDWSWSVLIQDFDNDLDQDIYITNGIYKRPNDLDYVNYLSSEIQKKNSTIDELINKMPSDRINNVYFENTGNTYQNKIDESGLSYLGYSNGAAYGDLDNDGDLDLVINNLNDKASIFKNNLDSSTYYLNVSLIDMETSNSYGVGSRVVLFSNGKSILKEISLTRGFHSAISNRLHFGLGSLNEIDSLHISWADGTIQKIYNVSVNQFITISKNSSVRQVDTKNKEINFTIDTLDFLHKEDEFKAYQVEKLMPWSTSVEGPAVVVSDLNGDGIKDFYLGGGHFQAGELFVSDSLGNFRKTYQPHITRDAGYEDIDAEFVDLNKDGKLDLIVTSGGNRFPEGHALLEDRIYLNNGSDVFLRKLVSFPKINSSQIAVQEDEGSHYICVGGRSIPGKYGIEPTSYLLKWNKDNVVSVDYYQMGFVTDLEWADLDNDNKIELLVAGKWSPIQSYQFDDGNLKKQDVVHFKNSHGFWNMIASGDINGDGRLDYFFGNQGENSKWKPSSADPITLYSADFDQNGQNDPIIFNPFFGESIPMASRMDLITQIPAIKKVHPNNVNFSSVRSIEALVQADYKTKKFYATETKSRLLLSKEGSYMWAELPDEVQYGAIQDASLDQGGKVIYVGNDFTNYAVLGRSDANPGGVFELSDSNIEWTELAIPHHLEYRRIEKLSASKYLIAPNSNAPFVITFN